MLKKVTCLVLGLFLLFGCTKNTTDDDATTVYRGMSEQQLYDHAVEAVQTADYSSAIKRFEAVDTLFPFSPHAKQTGLFLLYSYFMQGDYAQSAATAERYIHLFPRDKNVDYAYYMRGVANFEQQRGTFAKMFHRDPAWRDPGTQQASYQDFSALVKRFPQSRYYKDSLKRMIYLRNQFAQRELHIANFYMERKRYVAALTRANYLLKHYAQAPQAKQALDLAKQINSLLRLKDATKDNETILKDTFQNKA